MLLAYSQGTISSRAIEQACRHNVVFMAITGDALPHFTTFADLISRSLDAIASVFTQVLIILGQEGLIGRQHLATMPTPSAWRITREAQKIISIGSPAVRTKSAMRQARQQTCRVRETYRIGVLLPPTNFRNNSPTEPRDETCLSKIAASMLGVLLVSASGHAAVTDKSASGFTSVNTVTVKRDRDAVWRALTNIGQWWNGVHSYSGDASNLYLEPHAGGCFCESLPKGGSVEHLRVVYVQRPAVLRMTGGLGPLQALGVAGSWTFELVARADGGTQITLTAAVGGYLKEGLDSFAAPVDGVLKEQLTRLAAFAEKP